MDSSFWFDTIQLGWSIVYIKGSQVIILKKKKKKKKKKNSEFLSLKIVFVLTDSENPDEMLHYAAFHQGLHCLPKYAFRSHQ